MLHNRVDGLLLYHNRLGRNRVSVYNGVMRALTDFLLGALVLAGCTALYASPISMPIWVIFGVLFVFRTALRETWGCLTVLALLQLTAIGAYLGTSWAEMTGSRIYAQAQVSEFGAFSLAAAVLALLTFVSWRLPGGDVDSRRRRALSVTLQILVAATTVALAVAVLKK